MRALRASRPLQVLACGLLLAILGGGYLMAAGHGAAPTPNDDDPAAILRTLADQAVADGRLVAPAGRNAYEFYLSVLQLVPDDPAVQQSMRALLPAAAAGVETAINRGELDEAQRELRLLREFEPGNFTLALLGGKLDAQRQLVVRRDEALARVMQAGDQAR